MANDSSDATGLERTQRKIVAAALAVSRAEGPDVFGELVSRLAEILAVDATMIARFDGPPGRVTTLATCLDGRLLRTFQYDVDGTPCRAMVNRESRFVAHGVRNEFTPGTLFHAQGFDSYAAHSMVDGRGTQIGLIVAMHRHPLTDRALTEALLQVFAVRASAELDRRHADEATRASYASYRAIFDAAEDSILVHDIETGRVVDVNPKACRTYGYTRDELMRLRISDVSSNERPYTEVEAARYIEMARKGEPVRFEWHRRNKDGSLHWDEVVLKRATIAGHERILAFSREITERRRAEVALRTSEAQYRAIFNASADALVLRDADFRIVDVNATYETMSGHTRDSVIGLDRVIANPPEIADSVRALHARALAGEPIQLNTPFFRRDGTRYELELRGVPIVHQGAPHVLYIGRDVTARTRAESRREELESQLRQAQKMEAIGHLTGGIAHDFNNILTSVMGYIALAAERPGAATDPKLGSHLAHAEQSCHRARDLIQHMLAFSRGQGGEARPVALRSLLKESSRMLRATLPTTIELLSHVAGDPVASVDPVQAHQILLNLSINARDAMGETGRIVASAGSRRVSEMSCASCRMSFSGDFAELTVADSGSGIAPDVMERMFDPFFSTKETGRGSGMGLSIVHGVVHENGGHILVESQRGVGTTFRVLLPLASGEALEAPGVASDAPDGREMLEGVVLLVEDEPSVLGFMRELLHGWGLTVVATANPSHALRWFCMEPYRFDAVISDQTMPVMTGLELARELLARRSDLPVLLYSGRSELLDARAVAAAGVCRVLSKPIDVAALRAELRALLNP